MKVTMIASFGETVTTTKLPASRSQNSDYLAQRRKALSFRPKGEIFPRSLARSG